MKRFLLFILSLSLLTPFISRANVAGEEIYYKYIGDSTYRVFAVFYGTCQGTNYDYFYNIPTLKVYVVDSNATSPNALTMNLTRYDDGFGDSVNANIYCSKIVDNCNDPSSAYQGYTRYVYSGLIHLPGRSPKWRFEFLSEFQNCNHFSTWNSISNFTKRPGDNNLNLAMYASLNNSISDNSSPVYKDTVQTKYGVYCPGTQNVFNQNSTDSDNDSLYYSFSPTYSYYPSDTCGAQIQTMVPQPGYYYTNPLPGVYNLNHVTGTLDFNANGIGGNFYVSFTISEYRNGVLVGTSMRQRILPLDSMYCGIPATGHIDTTAATLHNVTVTGTDVATTCGGNQIGFHIPVSDSAHDTITVSVSNSIGSNIIISNNKTQNPDINFSWNTTGMPYGVYSFTAFFSTNSCPSPSVSSHNYTIVITDPNITVGDSIMSATQCLYKAAIRYEVQNGNMPYVLKVMQGADTLKTFSDSATYLYDSLAAGTYTMLLHTTGTFCNMSTDIVVPDNGMYPFKPTTGVSPVTYCRNGNDSALIAYIDSGANYLKWYDQTGNIIPAPVVPSTAIPGTYYYLVSQVYKTCESATDSMTVIINEDVCDFDVNIHNVITPNGDGKNDLWVIDNLDLYPDAKVEVFDKLGDKVYEQSHYSNNWDGGKVPSGVYYYTLDLGKPNVVTGSRTYTGYLMIKR